MLATSTSQPVNTGKAVFTSSASFLLFVHNNVKTLQE